MLLGEMSMAKTPEIDLRDSLVGNNLIINGDMSISQRGTNFVSPATASYTLDRWKYWKTGAMVHTISQDSDVPTFAQSGQYFSNSLRMNLTTPDDSIASNDYCLIEQRIEGYNFRKIVGRPFTISFWVKSTSIGIRTVAFRNTGLDRAYVAEYTIDSANTWEKKVITVLAPPSTGTWDYSNGTGLIVSFILVAGSIYNTTKDIWQTGTPINTAVAGNGTATGSTDFRITGVMLNEGTEALPFSLAGGNFDGEARLCQRYFSKSAKLSDGLYNSALGTTRRLVSAVSPLFGASDGGISFPVYMRAAPLVRLYPRMLSSSGGQVLINGSLASAGPSNPSEVGFTEVFNSSLSVTWSASSTLEYNYTADAEL